MIKKSMLTAMILGMFCGSMLFIFYSAVFAEKHGSLPETVTLYDREKTLLYEGSPDTQTNNTYKRAPFAVNLSLRKITKTYPPYKTTGASPSIITTIDLPLQNYLQALILENQLEWQEKNIANVAIVVVEGQDWDLRAAVGSENYFKDPQGPIDKISFEHINVISKEACPLVQDKQLLVWTVDRQGKASDNTVIKAFIQEKINEFEAQKGGESYGKN